MRGRPEKGEQLLLRAPGGDGLGGQDHSRAPLGDEGREMSHTGVDPTFYLKQYINRL